MASQPQERIDRINALAKKKRESGLTDAEAAEQAELRKAFLADFRAGMRQQVEETKFVDKNGNDVTPKKLVEIQRKRGLRKD
ncbi:DUF896 domain-containing protein [Lacticaseibacillus zhaodongensis]|uniref:DUF896 domain-containing protein n=1 Tax=Lacticaseibacillus zhaodongensis TaxID=2668065 RepID=UPI0012D369B0|nr:DUF896 domain-containing protein [Lacticaseibacillus zhaodongensis]